MRNSLHGSIRVVRLRASETVGFDEVEVEGSLATSSQRHSHATRQQTVLVARISFLSILTFSFVPRTFATTSSKLGRPAIRDE